MSAKAPGGKKVDGLQMAAEILNHLKGPERERLLANMIQANPALSKKIRERMFIFEDLIRISPKGMQTLLSQFPHPKLLLALRNAPDTLKEAVFNSFSARLSKLLQEEFSAQKPRLLSEVTRAQQELVSLATKLMSEGKIVLEDPKTQKMV